MVGALARALASNHEVRGSNLGGFISMVAIAMWQIDGCHVVVGLLAMWHYLRGQKIYFMNFFKNVQINKKINTFLLENEHFFVKIQHCFVK